MYTYSKKLVIYTFLITPSLLSSNSILSKIKGSVGLEYVLDKMKTKDNNTQTSSLNEVVELGYNDYIYNPNLLQYAASVKFDMRETETSNNDTTATSSKTISDYYLTLDILKKSKIPVRITASKNSSPSTQVNDDDILETTSSSENYSIQGAVVFDKNSRINYLLNTSMSESQSSSSKNENTGNNYNIDVEHEGYSVNTHHDSSSNESVNNDNELTTTKDNNYGLNIQKKFGIFDVKTKFEHLITDTSEGSNNNNQKEDVIDSVFTSIRTEDVSFDIKHKLNNVTNSYDATSNIEEIETFTNAKWTINDKISVRNSLYLLEEKIATVDNISEDFSVSWKPTKKYNLNSSVYTNTYEDGSNSTTNNGISLASQYNISDKLYTGQNLSYYTTESNAIETEDLNMAVNVQHSKPIFERSILNLRGETSAAIAQSTELGDTGETFAYDVTAGVLNRFETIGTLLENNLNYYQSMSTIINEEQKIRLDSAFETYIFNDISYVMESDFTHRKTFALVSTESNVTEKKLNVFNGIRTFKNLDVRGRLDADLGLKYSKRMTTNAEPYTSVSPQGTLNFSYRLWRTMTYRSSAKANRDSYSQITNYRMNNELLYKFRKLTIELGIDFNQQTGGDTGDVSTSNFTFLFKRSL